MKKILDVESPNGHYHAAVWCLECIDDRFRGVQNALKEHKNWHLFDRTQWAGGAKELALENPEHLTPIAEAILGQLAISLKLHDAQEVALKVHEACGAYGDAMPKDREEALRFMEAELRKAADVVHSYLEKQGTPRPVRLYAITFDGVYELD
jgi:hypothetical protein